MKRFIAAVCTAVLAATVLLSVPTASASVHSKRSVPELVNDSVVAYPGERLEIQLLNNDNAPEDCVFLVDSVTQPQQPGAESVVSGFAKTVTYQAPDEPSTDKLVDDSFTATVSCGNFTGTETIEVDLRMPVPLHVTVGVNKIKLVNDNEGVVVFSVSGKGCDTIDGSIGQYDPQWVYPTCSEITVVSWFVGGLPFDTRTFTVPQYHPRGQVGKFCKATCRVQFLVNNRLSSMSLGLTLQRENKSGVYARLATIRLGVTRAFYMHLDPHSVYTLYVQTLRGGLRRLDSYRTR